MQVQSRARWPALFQTRCVSSLFSSVGAPAAEGTDRVRSMFRNKWAWELRRERFRSTSRETLSPSRGELRPPGTLVPASAFNSRLNLGDTNMARPYSDTVDDVSEQAGRAAGYTER